MSHDLLCPNVACNCEPDLFGHMPLCPYNCQCELINKVRSDERSRWAPPWMSEDYARGYRQGQDDQNFFWYRIVRERLSDLESCGKNDDCRIKAEGVQLVIDDAIGELILRDGGLYR